MDFDRLKTGMKEIVLIVESVPERFKDRCFDALVTALLAGLGKREHAPREQDLERPVGPPPPTPAAPPKHVGMGTLPTLKGQVRVFMTRTKLSEESLAKVISYVDDEVHFIREPRPSKLSQGQIEWTLLSALKNAVETNVFTVDGNALRELCDEKGFLDAGNFWAIFARNGSLFTKPVTSADPKQSINTEGQTALAKLVEELAGQ